MAQKSKKKNEDVEAYRHETDKRKNAVPVGLASYDTSKPKPKEYEYDPHLDPQLEFLASADSLAFKLGKEKRIVPISRGIGRLRMSKLQKLELTWIGKDEQPMDADLFMLLRRNI